MPNGCGENIKIDFIARQDVVEDRAAFNIFWRHGAVRVPCIGESIAQLHLVEISAEAQCHILARAAKNIGQYAKAFLNAGNIFKQHGRRIVGMADKFGCKADLFLPIGTAHRLHFIQALRLSQPLTQIFIDKAHRLIAGL